MSKEYDDYLVEHKHAVGECLKLLAQEPSLVRNLSESLINDICENHDRSKLTIEEYEGYDRWFYGVKDESLEAEERFNYAWLHHIHNNPHHWQYWVIVEDAGSSLPMKIPAVFLVEMVADWGSFAYRKHMPLELKEWYDSHKDKIVMHPESRAKAEMLIDDLINKLQAKFMDERSSDSEV